VDDLEDLEDLEKNFHISKRDVKTIYKQIPERSFKWVSEVWDKRFRLKALHAEVLHASNNISSAIQAIFRKKHS